MKTINIKKALVFLVIALIAIGAGIFLYFSYDIINAKSSSEAAYWGALIGSILAGLIALISLVATLISNNKSQQETNKLQSSLKVEENLSQKLRKISGEITAAYNQLEIMLLIMQYLKVERGDFSPERSNIIEAYSKFRTAINGIRMNTPIYQNWTKCVDCTACNIKTYGELAKVTMALQKCFVQIDKEGSNAFAELETALSLAMDSGNILKNVMDRNELITHIKSSIELKNQLIQNVPDTEKTNIQHEINEYIKNIASYENELKDLEKTLDNNTNMIADCNKNARGRANHILTELKRDLSIAIIDYLDCYGMYIRESVRYTAKHGRALNSKCKKYDFEE